MMVLPLTFAAATAHATLTFVRHGQSVWNAEGRFTGWTDVPLTALGREEAAAGGSALREHGATFDIVFTSELSRAIDTAHILLEHSGQQSDVPVHRHWRLNERHYGMLTGQLKADAVAEHGAAQVKLWRHAYSIPPPRVAESHPLHPRHDKKYAHVPAHELPCGECLHQTLERCRPFFESHIAPELRRGRNVLVAAHGHVIRALIKELEQLSDDEVSHVSVPNGVPLVYKVDKALRPIAPLDHIGGSAAARGRYSCLGEWLDFCILDSRQQSSDGAGHGDISERGVSSV